MAVHVERERRLEWEETAGSRCNHYSSFAKYMQMIISTLQFNEEVC